MAECAFIIMAYHSAFDVTKTMYMKNVFYHYILRDSRNSLKCLFSVTFISDVQTLRSRLIKLLTSFLIINSKLARGPNVVIFTISFCYYRHYYYNNYRLLRVVKIFAGTLL